MFKRCVICLFTVGLASLFGIVMVVLHGNDAVGMAWIENAVWLVGTIGVVWLALGPICGWLGGHCPVQFNRLKGFLAKIGSQDTPSLNRTS